jgi:hypothetical protein
LRGYIQRLGSSFCVTETAWCFQWPPRIKGLCVEPGKASPLLRPEFKQCRAKAVCIDISVPSFEDRCPATAGDGNRAQEPIAVVLHLPPTKCAPGAIHVFRKNVRHAPRVPQDFGLSTGLVLFWLGSAQRGEMQDQKKGQEL